MDPASERNAVLADLTRAVALLEQSMSTKLVPLNGAQIGYAIRGARDKGGIASVQGRISGSAGSMKAGGPCMFGTDEEIARVILTVLKFDPRRRSAALLMFSDRARDVLEGNLFLECAAYDTARAPAGISTMDWAVAACCKKEVPDVMYPGSGDEGGAPLIILGEDPVDVANNIIICSKRI